jgi:thioester reductase-like protein
LRIGSVKTNIGHLESAAGVAGFIKLVLAVHYGEIPPHLHLERLNPHIAAGDFPIEIPTSVVPWTGRRIGGVSSFGACGTNAHIVVESAPARLAVPSNQHPTHILCISAKTPGALRETAARLERYIARHSWLSLSDVCFTLAAGRSQFRHGTAVLVSTLDEARGKLAAIAAGESPEPPLDAAEVKRRRQQERGLRVPLPASAFQRESYWIERSALPPPSAHPLLGRRLDTAVRDTIFETRFTPDSPAFLKDHLVYGVIVVPGACHVSLMLSAAQQVFGSGKSFLLEGITFFEPLLLLEGQTFTVQTVLTPETGDAGSLQIFSRTAADRPWTLHAAGKVKVESGPAPELPRPEVTRAYSAPGSDFYDQVYRVSFHFGPTFQWIETLHRTDEELVAEMRMPSAVTDAVACLMHPGLIDSCFQTFSAAQAGIGMDETAYAPLGIGSFRFYGRPSGKLWCRARRVGAAGVSVEILTGSFQLLDDTGRLVAQAQDLQIKRAPREALLRAAKNAMSDWFYSVNWQPSPLSASGPLHGSWLIVAGSDRLCNHLTAALRNRGAEAACIAVGQDPPVSAKPWRGVVHLAGLEDQAPAEACRSALSLIQSLVRMPQRPLPRLWIVTRGAQPVADAPSRQGAAQAAVWGLARTVALEHPELRCTAFDLCPSDDSISGLVAELGGDSPDDQVGVRHGARYVARLARSVAPSRKLMLRSDASYLIAGGLGGLGLLVARRLVETGARQIALIGRSAPSAAAHQAIADLHANVAVIQADLSNFEDARRALAQIQPPLAGIVHAASVIDDGMLSEQNWDRFRTVLRSKVSVAWNLHALTESLPLDFFVNFSSASSVLGSPGQSNYAAANAALDALAAYRHSKGLPGLSINWGPWLDSGIAARSGNAGLWTSFGLDSFTTQQGLDAFEAALGSDQPQVVIVRMSWSKLLTRLVGGLPPPLIASLAAGAASQPAAKSRSAAEQAILEEFEKAAPAARTALVSDYVRAATARVLGLDDARLVDPGAPFNDLGFDSLLALDLRNTLQSALNVNLAAAAIFERPTIDGLAGFIAGDLLHLPVEERAAGAAPAPIDWKAEAVLHSTIRPASGAASGPPSAILLTGATGFLGGYYLRELLQRTTADIYCLVRARSSGEACRRVAEKLSAPDPRVIPVPGDLSQPGFGLDPAFYDTLATRIDSILHSAAVVNFIHSYQSLKAATVLGTQEVLRFASHIRTKRMHHISTVAVFTSPYYRNAKILFEDDPLDHPEGLMVGYAQSKWVSEKLVRIARSRDLPVAIYRPGMITGDSRTGECKLDDFLPRMIRGCIQLGAAPDMRDFVMDLVPVDYCARGTVELSLRADSIGKAFNLLNPPPIPWNRIVERIREFGYPIRSVGYGEWLEDLRRAPADNALIYLLPVLEGLSEELFTWPRADGRNTCQGLAGSGIVCPPAEELLDSYLSYFVRVGYLPAPGEEIGASAV